MGDACGGALPAPYNNKLGAPNSTARNFYAALYVRRAGAPQRARATWAEIKKCLLSATHNEGKRIEGMRDFAPPRARPSVAAGG